MNLRLDYKHQIYDHRHKSIQIQGYFADITQLERGFAALHGECGGICRTTSITELSVNVHINNKIYNIERPICEYYEMKCCKCIIPMETLTKWNYHIKSAIHYQLNLSSLLYRTHWTLGNIYLSI